MGNTDSGSVDKYTTQQAFHLSLIADIILASATISNAITFYIRCQNGPWLVRCQIILIGLSGSFILTRDTLTLASVGANKSPLDKIAIGIANTLFQTVNTFTYWFFAYGYWIASFDIANDAEQLAEGGKSEVTKNKLESYIVKASAASGHGSQVQKQASHVSEGLEERDVAQTYGWINKLYTAMIIVTFIAFTVIGQTSPPYSNADCQSNRPECDLHTKCRSDCDLEDYIGNYHVWRLITIVLGA